MLDINLLFKYNSPALGQAMALAMQGHKEARNYVLLCMLGPSYNPYGLPDYDQP